MAKEEDKSHILHPKPEMTFSSFPKVPSSIPPEEKRKAGAGPKDGRQETTDKVPI